VCSLTLAWQGSHSNHFLAGRALWAAAKLARLMSPDQVDVYLSAACAGGLRHTLVADCVWAATLAGMWCMSAVYLPCTS
jgi:hypothetical protein